jgi:hypothetical protein
MLSHKLDIFRHPGVGGGGGLTHMIKHCKIILQECDKMSSLPYIFCCSNFVLYIHTSCPQESKFTNRSTRWRPDKDTACGDVGRVHGQQRAGELPVEAGLLPLQPLHLLPLRGVTLTPRLRGKLH